MFRFATCSALMAFALVLSFAPAPGPLLAVAPANAKEKEKEKGKGKDDNEDAKFPRWFVYQDAESKENHGHWTNVMQSALVKDLVLVDRVEPAFGETCIKVNVKFQTPNWCGIAVSCKADYWGEEESNEAYDLRKAKMLVFYARGAKGGESIQVKAAITGDKKYGDSSKIAPATPWLKLDTTWQRYELKIDQKKYDFKRVVTPFCFVTDKAHNRADEITVYFDHIYYVLE